MDMPLWQSLLTILPTRENLVCLYFLCTICLGPDRNSEESLIDFHKLIGEHSGENMATVVWETLKMYCLTDRVSI